MPGVDTSTLENDLTSAAVRETEKSLSNLKKWDRKDLTGDTALCLRYFLARLAALLGERETSEDAQLAAEERLAVAFDKLMDELRLRRRVKRTL